MNLISIRKKRRPAIALLLCTGLLGACPPDAVADAGDRLPVPEIQQSKSPVKRTLVGTVTDASTGETLIGVNVIIKGTTQGTVTDLDGKFSIEVTGKDEIEISYIGYKTQTIEVGDLGVLNVKMEGDNEVLDEVVVVGAVHEYGLHYAVPIERCHLLDDILNVVRWLRRAVHLIYICRVDRVELHDVVVCEQ